MRHAKSSWSNPTLKDFDRPLNSRGKNDAPKIGLFLKEQQLIPQKIYCSPANRTRKTLKRILKKLNKDEIITEFEENLYFQGYDTYLKSICSTSPDIDIVMTLGHNPMTEELVSVLSATPVRKPIKTATITCLTIDIENWDELKPGSCNLKWIISPKDLS
jgi:phosphohistidine phosphatase